MKKLWLLVAISMIVVTQPVHASDWLKNAANAVSKTMADAAEKAKADKAAQTSGGQTNATGAVDATSAVKDSRIMGFEVIGIKLGMTMTEVASSMQANYPEMALTKTMTPPRIPSEGMLELPYYEFKSPRVEYVASVYPGMNGKRMERRTKASLDTLTVTFAPESVGGGAVRLQRLKQFEWEQGPSFDNLLSSVKKKYGNPGWSSEDSYQNSVSSGTLSAGRGFAIAGLYGYGFEGKSFAEIGDSRKGSGLECQQTHSAFGGVQKGHPYNKCSQMASFGISGTASDEGIVMAMSLRMIMTDWTPLLTGYEHVAKAQNAAFDEQQRKKQEQVDKVGVDL
jgi:hypothetical protein